MDQLQETSFSRFLAFVGVSFALHTVSLLVLQTAPPRTRPLITEKVKVQIQEKAKPEAPPVPTPAPTPPPPKPPELKKSAPRPTQTKAPDQAPPPPPVLGLNPNSMSADGKSNFAVPLGNTTDAPDEGKRLTPEQVKALAKDLSADATLIGSSFVSPPYTEEAEDAGLEGLFVVEVFVDTEGRVGDAELRTKIGYGMDARVLETVRKARFTPRRDPLGKPLAGWTEIKVRLTLE